MKFGNGYWLNKKGCQVFSPKQCYDIRVTDKKVVIFAPCDKITGRGDTLGGVTLTLTITSPEPEIIRMRAYHHLGSADTFGFDLELTEEVPLETKQDEEYIFIASGALTLRISKLDGTFSYIRNGEIITTSGINDLAMVKTNWQGMAYDTPDSVDTYMRQQLSLSVDEHIYGMGERFTPFVKNGQTVEIWNRDGGTSTDQSYKNIPFFISDRGYGVFVNHPENVSFEIGSDCVTKTEFSLEGGYLDYFFINGPTMKDVLVHYTDLTGKPALPAPWTFGLWLSTSFTTNYDEKTVMSFIDGCLERGIPLKTFHFDCFWMKEYHWSNLIWDERVFPDPAGMLGRIKEKGLKICVWINSYIAQESELFEEGMREGYFLKRADGSVWQWDMWQPGMAIVDFTNPKAKKWFQDKLSLLLDMGVDCFKTDFGERIPTDCVYYNHADPKKMHNYYTYLYNQAVYELLQQKRGEKSAVLFARSATAGGQKFPVHWGGDCWSDYPSMEESLHGGLSLLMSGFGFWSHDIGGFESTSTADVYKRWLAFGLFSSHSRLHGSSSYRVPWAYDEEAVDVARHFAKWKAKLMPYIYRNAVETSSSGIPMMRSMVLEYPEDPACTYLDKQYFFGDSILVSPIFNEDGIGKYYLPEGTWTHLFSGEEKQGEKWYSQTYDYMSMPIFVKAGSVIALGSCDTKPDYTYSDQPELVIYMAGCEKEYGTVIYDSLEHSREDAPKVKVCVSETSKDLTVSIEGGTEYLIRIVNAKLQAAGYEDLSENEKDTLIKVSSVSGDVLKIPFEK